MLPLLQDWEIPVQVLLLSRDSDHTSLALMPSQARKTSSITRKQYGG